MKLILDESIDRPIADALKNEGYKIWYVLDMDRGISDDKVMEIANRNDALLLTTDKDFGELVFRKKMITTGVVLFRVFGISNNEKAELISSVLKNYSNELLQAFTVVTPKTIRIRKIDYLQAQND